MSRAPLSIIIPTLNEVAAISTLLEALQPMRARGCELVLVDGGSGDATIALAAPLVDQLIQSGPGRAQQMNVGAQHARAAMLWFLHADSCVPMHADQMIREVLNTLAPRWGYFPIRLSGTHPLLRTVEWAMNQRVRWTHVITGDHGVFISRSLFECVGGFPMIALMEDIAISKKLRILSRPHRLRHAIVTSSRRWESRGVLRTILKMWCLRLLYCFGASPELLANYYRK